MLSVRCENLRAYLKNNRGSQTRLAQELQIGVSNISQWCSGKRQIPEDTVKIIENFLGIDLDDPNLIADNDRVESRNKKEQLLCDVVHRLSDKSVGDLLIRALELEQNDKT